VPVVAITVDNCGVVQPPITWRQVLPLRLFGVLWVVFMCFLTVVTMIGLARGEGLDAVLGLAVFGVVRIPLEAVVDVSAGYYGLTITLASGTRVSAWAVQKSNLASWFNRHTRADDVAEAILAAAREAVLDLD
jgi:hypothetical protein